MLSEMKYQWMNITETTANYAAEVISTPLSNNATTTPVTAQAISPLKAKSNL